MNMDFSHDHLDHVIPIAQRSPIVPQLSSNPITPRVIREISSVNIDRQSAVNVYVMELALKVPSIFLLLCNKQPRLPTN